MPTDSKVPPTVLQHVRPIRPDRGGGTAWQGERPQSREGPATLAVHCRPADAAPAADTPVGLGRPSGSTSPEPHPAPRPLPDPTPRVAPAPPKRPAVGSVFDGFRLVEEIGRGAFSHVYLARQGDLADRAVVLKVTTDARVESNALAKLRHPNIVPIHSAHRVGAYHVVCMPFFGTVTLADVYRELEGMPSLPNSGRGLFTTLTVRRGSTAPPGGQAPAGEAPGTPPALASLEGRSYVDAVLWLAAGVADGLAHAHDRGVVHRDLKPANVLLTDDGQPMLLDFNLAGPSRAAAEAQRGGGTPPYMSPEQFAVFAGRPTGIDGRSDLYSLGVVMYELLTRRSPFPRYPDFKPDTLEAMIADRQGPPPAVRRWSRAVSPAVESIVRRCLEPDPARRYQSAHELKDDLERQLADRPLRHAADPSARERFRKWRRRHRVLTSSAGLVATVVTAAVVLAACYGYWGARLARLDAADTFRQFTADAQAAQIQLADRGAGRDRADEGVRACEAALGRYRVLENADWDRASAVAGLPPADRDRLRDEVGGMLTLLAKATTRRATLDAGRADPQPDLQRAFAMTDAALACYAGRAEPRAVWEQRADLARLLGRPDDARQMALRAAATPAESPADRLLLAHQFAAQGEYRKALPLLRGLTRDDPTSFVAWFVQGVCNLGLLRDADAVGCFNSCLALRPDFHWAWYNRGLAARRQRNFEQARADFDRVVALRPEFALGHLHRGLVRHELKDYPGAVADLTRAYDLGGPATSILFRRAAAQRAAGDPVAADKDTQEALRRDPADEDGFVDRGLARVHRDPPGALADFDAALRLNPQSYRALQNKAAILADKFRRDADALKVLDEAVALYPDAVLARAGRGLLLARLGNAERAVEDAREAARADASPSNLYQVGCIYALLSAARPEYKLKAIQVLTSAVKQGYGHDRLDRDPDLAALRGSPEFRQMADATRSLHGVAH